MVSIRSGNSRQSSSEASRLPTLESEGIFDNKEDSSSSDEELEQEVVHLGIHKKGKKTKVCLITVIYTSGAIADLFSRVRVNEMPHLLQRYHPINFVDHIMTPSNLVSRDHHLMSH
jgi:hypothetical protein